jgi:hypothetical protein
VPISICLNLTRSSTFALLSPLIKPFAEKLLLHLALLLKPEYNKKTTNGKLMWKPKAMYFSLLCMKTVAALVKQQKRFSIALPAISAASHPNSPSIFLTLYNDYTQLRRRGSLDFAEQSIRCHWV